MQMRRGSEFRASVSLSVRLSLRLSMMQSDFRKH